MGFKTIKKQNIPNLIIDIRGNGGGSDDVYVELGKYLMTKDFTRDAVIGKIAFETVPQSLRPYVNTWDKRIYSLGKKGKKTADGFHTLKNEGDLLVKAKKNALKFYGQTYLITDASNNSATHLLATYAKKGEFATLVGQTTGGNQRGINGSYMFFLTLPNSKVEIDIPLVAGMVQGNPPNAGLAPDVYVAPNVKDVVNGRDTEMEAIMEIIADNNKGLNKSEKSTVLNGDEFDSFAGEWSGQLKYLNYGDDKSRFTVPFSQAIMESKGNKMAYKIIYDEIKDGKPIIHKGNFSIAKDGKSFKYSGEWTLESVEKLGDKTIIVGNRIGKDKGNQSDIRLTVTIEGKDSIYLKKEVRYQQTSSDYFIRNEFWFNRK